VAAVPVVDRGWVNSAVLAMGAVVTGPRSAAAFSMPGFKPAACPPDGVGGAVNGVAGLTKLVTPGGAAPGPVAGASVCTGGEAVVVGGVGGLTAAVGGGVNMLIAGAWAWARAGMAGAWVCTLAIGDTVGALVLVAGADSGAWPSRPAAASGAAAAGEITAVAACSAVLIAAEAIEIPALAATSAAAIAGAATEPPAIVGSAESAANAAPKPSNPAP
jgi:hypothetical protein